MSDFEQQLEANRIASKKAKEVNKELTEEVRRRTNEIIEL